MSATAVVMVVLGAIGTIVVAVLTGLAKSEVDGWLPYLADKFIRLGVRKLPPDERPRWEAEALADIDAYRDRPVTALAHAIGVWRTARELAAELEPDPEPVPAADARGDRARAGLRTSAGGLGAWLAASMREARTAIRGASGGRARTLIVVGLRAGARGLEEVGRVARGALQAVSRGLSGGAARTSGLERAGLKVGAGTAAAAIVTAGAIGLDRADPGIASTAGGALYILVTALGLLIYLRQVRR